MNEQERIDHIIIRIVEELRIARTRQPIVKRLGIRTAYGMVTVLLFLVNSGNPTPEQTAKANELHDEIIVEIYPDIFN